MNSCTRMTGLLVILALLTACAQKGADQPRAEPDWVAGESAEHPAASWLIGRGQATDADRARDRARADLAKIFEVAIDEVTRDLQTFRSTRDGDGQDSRHGELDVARELRTRTDRVVRGVEIADQWQDPESGHWHALATLSRARAGQALRSEIRELDQTTEAWLNRARQEDDLLRQVAAATRAVATQQQRQGLQQSLQAVDATGRGVPARWSLGQLQSDRDELLGRIRVTAAASGENSERVQRLLRGALASAGVHVTENGDYRMQAHLDYDTIGPRDGWYWVSGKLELSLEDSTGSTRGSHNWDLRLSASEQPLLAQRLLTRIEALLEAEIAATLAGFVNGEQ